MQKKTSTLIGILILVAVAIVLVGGAIVFFKSQTPMTNDQLNPNIQISNTNIADWKTYKNDQYGFEFKYPDNAIAIAKNPISDTCGYDKLIGCKFFTTKESKLQIALIGLPLNDYIIAEHRHYDLQYNKLKEPVKKIIGGRKGYEYDYDNRAEMDDRSFSHTHGFMIPINERAYLEVSEYQGCNLDSCISNCCDSQREMSNKDWDDMMSTLKFIN